MAYAAGVMLLSWHQGQLYTLVGKDQYNTYSDFGGKCDYSDKGNVIVTAAREMYEEMCGCYLSITEVIHQLYNAPVIHTLSYTNKPYHMYLLFINYDEELCKRFDIINEFIRHTPCLGKFKEKTSIKWCLFSEVMSETVILRNIFKRTMKYHKQAILINAYKYKTRNTKYNYGQRRS